MDALAAENVVLRAELQEAIGKIGALEERLDRLLALLEDQLGRKSSWNVSGPADPKGRQLGHGGIEPSTGLAGARTAKAKTAKQQTGSGPGGRIVPGLDRAIAQPQAAGSQTAQVAPLTQREQGAPADQGWQEVRRRGPRPQGARPDPKTLQKRRGAAAKAAEQALADKAAPADFRSVFVELKDPRGLLRAQGRERELAVRVLLQTLGIDKLVSGASLAPGGVLQLVCRLGAAVSVEEAMAEAGLKTKPSLDPFKRIPHSRLSAEVETEKTALRAAFLCRQSQARNYHEAVLHGATPEQRAQVLVAYRKLVRKPDALLGHEGRWYAIPNPPHLPVADHSDLGNPAVAGAPDRDDDADMNVEAHH
jgi:hypothetical protein